MKNWIGILSVAVLLATFGIARSSQAETTNGAWIMPPTGFQSPTQPIVMPPAGGTSCGGGFGCQPMPPRCVTNTCGSHGMPATINYSYSYSYRTPVPYTYVPQPYPYPYYPMYYPVYRRRQVKRFGLFIGIGGFGFGIQTQNVSF